MCYKMKRHRIRKFLLPILCLFAVVGSAVFRLAGDGIQFAPAAAPGLIQLALFFLRELFVGNKFFHSHTSLFFIIPDNALPVK